MQAIAAENNLSETAFTVPSERDDADYDLRWFTPTVEVDLCGHATLAAAHILMHGEQVRFATQVGHPDGHARRRACSKLDLPAAPADRGDRARALLERSAFRARRPVSADGCNDSGIVLVDDEAAVRAVAPDFAALRKIHRMAIVTAPGDDQDIASRVFVALSGIDEDPVTGSAHAALVPFGPSASAATASPRSRPASGPACLDCELRGDRVILGGHAVTVIEGYFQL